MKKNILKKRDKVFMIVLMSCLFTAAWHQTVIDIIDGLTEDHVTITTINDDGTEEVHEYIVDGDQWISIDE